MSAPRYGFIAVSSTSSRNCVTIGVAAFTSDYSVTYYTLVDSWNGSAWIGASNANPGDSANALNGLSCSSVSDCVAVIDYGNHLRRERNIGGVPFPPVATIKKLKPSCGQMAKHVPITDTNLSVRRQSASMARQRRSSVTSP